MDYPKMKFEKHSFVPWCKLHMVNFGSFITRLRLLTIDVRQSTEYYGNKPHITIYINVVNFALMQSTSALLKGFPRPLFDMVSTRHCSTPTIIQASIHQITVVESLIYPLAKRSQQEDTHGGIWVSD